MSSINLIKFAFEFYFIEKSIAVGGDFSQPIFPFLQGLLSDEKFLVFLLERVSQVFHIE
ncbi:Uncharacterised protein [Streptococcus thermophilus]|uniref:Uncharacterized protein n=1 Tax=Streptococcus thermophilus TaxID=1308 RepID=A0A2X3U6F0_STRTR|nr:Uncharacterised protein [Streptococcus thermophilus]